MVEERLQLFAGLLRGGAGAMLRGGVALGATLGVFDAELIVVGHALGDGIGGQVIGVGHQRRQPIAHGFVGFDPTVKCSAEQPIGRRVPPHGKTAIVQHDLPVGALGEQRVEERIGVLQFEGLAGRRGLHFCLEAMEMAGQRGVRERGGILRAREVFQRPSLQGLPRGRGSIRICHRNDGGLGGRVFPQRDRFDRSFGFQIHHHDVGRTQGKRGRGHRDFWAWIHFPGARGERGFDRGGQLLIRRDDHQVARAGTIDRIEAEANLALERIWLARMRDERHGAGGADEARVLLFVLRIRQNKHRRGLQGLHRVGLQEMAKSATGGR